MEKANTLSSEYGLSEILDNINSFFNMDQKFSFMQIIDFIDKSTAVVLKYNGLDCDKYTHNRISTLYNMGFFDKSELKILNEIRNKEFHSLYRSLSFNKKDLRRYRKLCENIFNKIINEYESDTLPTDNYNNIHDSEINKDESILDTTNDLLSENISIEEEISSDTDNSYDNIPDFNCNNFEENNNTEEKTHTIFNDNTIKSKDTRLSYDFRLYSQLKNISSSYKIDKFSSFMQIINFIDKSTGIVLDYEKIKSDGYTFDKITDLYRIGFIYTPELKTLNGIRNKEFNLLIGSFDFSESELNEYLGLCNNILDRIVERYEREEIFFNDNSKSDLTIDTDNIKTVTPENSMHEDHNNNKISNNENISDTNTDSDKNSSAQKLNISNSIDNRNRVIKINPEKTRSEIISEIESMECFNRMHRIRDEINSLDATNSQYNKNSSENQSFSRNHKSVKKTERLRRNKRNSKRRKLNDYSSEYDFNSTDDNVYPDEITSKNEISLADSDENNKYNSNSIDISESDNVKESSSVSDYNSSESDNNESIPDKNNTSQSDMHNKLDDLSGGISFVEASDVRAMNKKKNTKVILFIVAVVIVLLLASIFWFFNKNKSENNISSENNNSQELYMENETSENNNVDEKKESTTDDVPELAKVKNYSDEFIEKYMIPDDAMVFPDSSERYLTKEELSSFNVDEIALIRNELFAKNGRIYEEGAYKSYFEGKSWYNPISPDINMYDFNEFDKANFKLILQIEESLK